MSLTGQQVWDYLSLYHIPAKTRFKPDFYGFQVKTDIKQVLLKETEKMLETSNNPCLLLSGGVDSSVIGLILSELDTSIPSFTIDFYEGKSEALKAEIVAEHLGLENKRIPVSSNDLNTAFEQVNQFHSTPYPAHGELALFKAFEHLSKKGFDTIFTGDGGDELFMGYPGYSRYDNWHWLKDFGAGHLVDFAAPFVNDKAKCEKAKRLFTKGEHPYILKTGGFLEKEKAELFGRKYNSTSGLLWNDETPFVFRNIYDNFFFHDFNRRMPVLGMGALNEDSKHFGIKVLSPILCQNVFDYAMRIPITSKIRGGITKKLLKDILVGSIPDEIIYAKKIGMGIPLEVWKKVFSKELNELNYWEQPFFNNLESVDGTRDKQFMLLTLKKWMEVRE